VDEETKEKVRAWKRGMEEMNRFVREENRRRTPEERLQNVLRLMARAGIGPRNQGPERELTPAQQRWIKAAERFLARAQ
jgi:hypothetical protein